jgi:hypothetical protein
MYQIYFLSILLNLVAGIVLAHESLMEKISFDKVIVPDLLQNPGFKAGLGVFTFVVGFLKFLSVTQGDVPVAGDLLPALSGLIMGFTLVLQYYKEKSNVTTDAVKTMDNIFAKNRNFIGIIGIIIAVIHFFLPRVLFL